MIEGFWIWISRDYFKFNFDVVILLFFSLKEDDSEYLRKFVGNVFRDISKKYLDLVKKELDLWDILNKKVEFVYKFVLKCILVK